MSAVKDFALYRNSFEGTIPESGLAVLRNMRLFDASSNRFAGTLPNRAVAGLRFLSVVYNDFEGKLSQTPCGPHL
eukprot:3491333-Amphidinium_carterae.1